MTDYGKIGRFVAEATGTPVKSAKKGKAAEIKKVKHKTESIIFFIT